MSDDPEIHSATTTATDLDDPVRDAENDIEIMRQTGGSNPRTETAMRSAAAAHQRVLDRIYETMRPNP